MCVYDMREEMNKTYTRTQQKKTHENETPMDAECTEILSRNYNYNYKYNHNYNYIYI